LPAHPSLEWLRKTAKDQVRELRAERPQTTLAQAQRDIARRYGFQSWRALKAHVDGLPGARDKTDDSVVGRFLERVGVGDIRAVRAAITADPGIVNAVGPAVARSEAVLMGAVDFGHHDLVRWLLAHGADPNARSAVGSRGTALHSAAWEGDLDMARLLVTAGADARARDAEHDNTPAGWARVAVDVTNNPRCAEVAGYLDSLT
jgi:hypothetical protein